MNNNPLRSRQGWSQSDSMGQSPNWDRSQTALEQRKVYAIHIGVSEVLASGYDVKISRLKACVQDARTYGEISQNTGHTQVDLLLNENATRRNLLYLLEKYAKLLTRGDLLWVTFSGHGGTIKDQSQRKVSGLDQCWCLYDTHVTDDELCLKFSKFKKGVRILVIADSCYSGGMFIEPMLPLSRQDHRIMRRENRGWERKYRCEDNTVIEASIFLMSACQKDGKSYQGRKQSVFSLAVKQAWRCWKKSKKKGSYLDFWQAAKDVTYSKQIPTYQIIGPKTPWTTKKEPFDID